MRKRDSCAPDGCVASGDRLVRKGGVIKFAAADWQSDKLIPFVGKYFGVRAEGYWIGSITIWYPTYPEGEFVLEIGDKNVVMPLYHRLVKGIGG